MPVITMNLVKIENGHNNCGKIDSCHNNYGIN